jgi:CarD family transcriptional regulator
VTDPPFVGANLGERLPGDWSRRYKANVARLRSGDPQQIAEVVELLTDREARYGLSQGERRMLDRAQQMLEEPRSEA